MRKILKKIFLLSLISYFLLQPSSVFAVSTSIQNPPMSITTDPFTLSININGPTPGQNYLRADIYQDGTNNYFGYTFNGTSMYSGSDYTQYLSVTIDQNKSWSGTVQAKLDTSASEYKGPASYKVRIRRYTSSGNYEADEANANAITVNVIAPSFTPTPSPTSVPTETPKPPSPTPKPPTTTPNPTNTPSPTAVVTPSRIPVPSLASPTNDPLQTQTQPGQVLAASDIQPTIDFSSSLTPTPIQSQFLGENESKIGWFFVGGGIIFLASGIIMFVWNKRKRIRQAASI